MEGATLSVIACVGLAVALLGTSVRRPEAARRIYPDGF